MQAINDAEADEKIADQLVALERSMSQENAESVAEKGAGQGKADAPKNQQQVKIASSPAGTTHHRAYHTIAPISYSTFFDNIER